MNDWSRDLRSHLANSLMEHSTDEDIFEITLKHFC